MPPIPAPVLDRAPRPGLTAAARTWRQRLLRTIGCAGALILLATAVHAQPVCRGNDLLPDLAKSQPALHAKILEAVRNEPNGEALLWKISDPKQASPEPKVSWLLGTIHLTDTRVHALSPAIQEALASAKVLALEVDDIGPKAMQKAFSQNEKLLAPRDGRHLDKLLTAAELASLRTITTKLGLPVSRALLMRPWFLTTLMSLPACESARQEAGFKPLDFILAGPGRKAGHPHCRLGDHRRSAQGDGQPAAGDRAGLAARRHILVSAHRGYDGDAAAALSTAPHRRDLGTLASHVGRLWPSRPSN